MSSQDWDFVLDYSDVNRANTDFLNLINNAYCKNFPIKTKFISSKRTSKTWLSPNVKKLINLKSEYFKMFRRGLITRESNNLVKNLVNREIRKAKFDFYKNLFNAN